jgi:YNFM family putative membrane transporter
VILGVALANLPFGMIVDRFPIRPIILIGGSIVAAGSIVCALTDRMWLFIGMRFIQGLFIPSLTTCIAAYLAQTLPAARLNVVMGSYVSATVAGGLGGRLLGGWIHPPLHWRYAFVTSSLLVLLSTIASVIWLPRENHRKEMSLEQAGFMDLVVMPGVSRMLIVGFGAFFVFSSIFNYLPFYLSKPPFSARTEVITLLYLAYLVGIIIGPLSGRISNRIGSGATMVSGAVMFGIALASTLIPSLIANRREPRRNLRGFFLDSRGSGRTPEPKAHIKSRTSQLPIRPLLLRGRRGRNHGVRLCLRCLRMGRGNWTRAHRPTVAANNGNYRDPRGAAVGRNDVLTRRI